MATSPLITLTTDFGDRDGFAGVMTAIIYSINPAARVVSLTHGVPPQDIGHASFVLGTAYPYLPDGGINVAVVDPGVGTDRRAIVARGPGRQIYVGPDNGLFTHVMKRSGSAEGASESIPYLAPMTVRLPEEFEAWSIENDAYTLSDRSRTFHGRDVFGPVAGHLSLGVSPSVLGPPVDELTLLNLPGPRLQGESVVGHVQYIDRFGNLATDIPSEMATPRHMQMSVAGTSGIREWPAYHGTGAVGFVRASHGYLEVVSASGNAARQIQACVGDSVSLDSA